MKRLSLIAMFCLTTATSSSLLAQNQTQQLDGFSVVTGAVGDTADSATKKWVALSCPPGQLVAGAHVNQGGWLALFQVVCVTPSRSGSWAGEPVEGGSAGGQNGSHDARVLCPRNQWVSGIAGRITTVFYGPLSEKYVYLADPVLYCSGVGQPNVETVSDPAFKKEQQKNINSAKYADAPAQFCPAGSFATGADVAIGGKTHPDVRAARLHCGRIT